jgi:hypothetical protein
VVARLARRPCCSTQSRKGPRWGARCYANADLSLLMESQQGSRLGRSVADALVIPVIDLYVHAWDLGPAVSIAVEIPANAIDYAHGTQGR